MLRHQIRNDTAVCSDSILKKAETGGCESWRTIKSLTSEVLKSDWLTDWLTDWRTPWNRALSENQRGPRLVQKSPEFYGTQTFITAFTKARAICPYREADQSNPYPYHYSWRSTLILSSHERTEGYNDQSVSVVKLRVGVWNRTCGIQKMTTAFNRKANNFVYFTALLDPAQGQLSFPFSRPSRPALGPTQPFIRWVTEFFPRGKAGQDVMLTTHVQSSALNKCSYKSTPRAKKNFIFPLFQNTIKTV
jgi:hypothetical protein